MTTEIPEDILEAITAVVYWARSSDDDIDILMHDIPLLDRWVVELGLLPPAKYPITDEEWIAFNEAGAAWKAGRRYAASEPDGAAP